MSWVRIDDQYSDHPKIVAVGPLGMALHTAALCYCAKYLTDGFIPSAMIPRLISLDSIYVERNGVTNTVSHKEVTDELTKVGLFEIVEGGFFIHDYLVYNPPAEKVKAERTENAARQAAWREKRRSNAVTKPATNGHVTRPPTPSPLKDSCAEAQKEPAIEEPEPEPEPASTIIKNQGAYNALVAYEQARKNGKPDVGWLSEHLRPLAEMFIAESSIVPLKGEHKFWIRSIGNLYDIGAKPEHIKKAIRKMRGDGLTIKSPESCLANIRDELARSVQPDNITWK